MEKQHAKIQVPLIVIILVFILILGVIGFLSYQLNEEKNKQNEPVEKNTNFWGTFVNEDGEKLVFLPDGQMCKVDVENKVTVGTFDIYNNDIRIYYSEIQDMYTDNIRRENGLVDTYKILNDNTLQKDFSLRPIFVRKQFELKEEYSYPLEHYEFNDDKTFKYYNDGQLFISGKYKIEDNGEVKFTEIEGVSEIIDQGTGEKMEYNPLETYKPIRALIINEKNIVIESEFFTITEGWVKLFNVLD